MKAELIIIENDEDLKEAAALVSDLMIENDSVAMSRMAAQAYIIDEYEKRRWPHKPVTVPELLLYLMEQHGMTWSDLVPLLGAPGRVKAILSGKADLSMRQVLRLRDRFSIPADVFLPPQT